jgi:hypothetical protein
MNLAWDVGLPLTEPVGDKLKSAARWRMADQASLLTDIPEGWVAVLGRQPKFKAVGSSHW